MGTCPFCRAQTLPGDSICYSCGRVITGASGMDARVKGEFMRSPTRKARRGVAPRHAMTKGQTKRRGRKKRSRINQLGLVAFLAFIFFTPEAKQFVLAKWAEVEEYINDALAGWQTYPLEAEYTVVRSVDLWNNNSDPGWLKESIPIPTNVVNKNSGVALAYTDGTEVPLSKIQEIVKIELRIDGEVISVPLVNDNGNHPILKRENAITTQENSEVWWPGETDNDSNSDYCSIRYCVKVSMDITPNSHETLDFAVTLKSTSHSWWHSTRVDGKLDGKSEGVSVQRSGTLSEISERGSGIRANQFTAERWYDRGGYSSGGITYTWAIDSKQATAPTVYQTAASISASLPSDLKNNAYAYARATFDWLNDNIPYDTNAPGTARGGEQCLDMGLGDCDEQSNAFMSIMRVKGIPTWYVFGALADPEFTEWEGHAWAYIMLPMSEEWCENNDVILNECYIEGAVDVVNRKWLVHTPTAYIDWIEPYSDGGQITDGYYYGGTKGGIDRLRSFYTEDYDVSGGTWDNKWVGENLA
jgi:hypothetical protein